MANFGPLLSGHPHQPNANCYIFNSTEGKQELHGKVGSLSPAKHLVEFEPGYLNECLNLNLNALTI